MATITTDTYLDSGTARTAGETWSINGCALTVRTDTRWHAGSPASMTGSLGAITISSMIGGSFNIDGTKVRWMAFDSGSGTVPAIGTTITQGGVTGYLLGIWADYVSAPTAVGSTMPTSGYLKFREVTGGTFNAGALTGISANASSADVTGWIEVVIDQSTQNNSLTPKANLNWVGDWFYLGTTSGTAGQIVQLPTNGGGTGTTFVGVQIETSPGSGVYEWFTGLNTTYWTTSYISTDVRAKIVESVGSGQIRIGADSSSNRVGYLPTAGCKIRVPNIFMRQCTTAARASNASPSTAATTRPTFQTYGNFVIDKAMVDCNFGTSYPPANVAFSNSCFEKLLTFNSTKFSLSNSCIANATANATTAGFSINYSTVSISNVAVTTIGTQAIALSYCSGTLSNSVFRYIANNSSTTAVLNITYSSNLTISSCYSVGGSISLNGDKITVSNFDFTSKSIGTTGTTSSTAVLINATNCIIDGLSFGFNRAIADVHPYSQIFSISNTNGPVKIRNIGSIDSPLNCGSSNYPGSFYNVTTPSVNNLSINKCYISNFRSAFISGYSYSSNLILENVGSSENLSISSPISSDSILSGLILTVPSTVTSPGTNWMDFFKPSTNTGTIKLFANQLTTKSSAYVTLSVANTTIGGFNSNTLVLPTAGDYVIFETPNLIYGHTGFSSSVAVSTSATGTYTYQYQLYNPSTGTWGSWTTLNATNLSAESISYSLGFKLRIKITTTVSSTSNVFTSLTIGTITSSNSIKTYYPLDSITMTINGLQPGSEVRAYVGSDPATAVEIGGIESSGTSFSFTHSHGGETGFIRIMSLGYDALSYDPYTYSTSDETLLVQQIPDRNYVNP